MKVFAAMTRDVIVISPEVTLGAAKRMMERWRIRHLPVVSDGRLVGILSDRDVLRYEGAIEDGPEVRAGEAMTVAPVTCESTAPVSRVAQMMLDHKIDSVPVVDAQGRVSGLVTSSDLLLLLVDRSGVELLPFDYRVRFGEEDGMLAEAGS
jgi:acetoin utilization protein AcuB